MDRLACIECPTAGSSHHALSLTHIQEIDFDAGNNWENKTQLEISHPKTSQLGTKSSPRTWWEVPAMALPSAIPATSAGQSSTCVHT